MLRFDFLKSLNQFGKDESATATVEFVLFLPLLITWFISSIVFFDAFMERNLAAKASHTILDMLSRKGEAMISAGEVTQYLNLQTALLPQAPSAGSLRVSSIVYIDADTGYEVRWSEAVGASTDVLLTADIPIALLPLMAEGETVILLDTRVPYRPLADWVQITVTGWSNRVAISPRFAAELRHEILYPA